MLSMNTMGTGDAARYLGKSVKTLQRWDREGVLVASRLPTGRRIYTKSQLDAFISVGCNCQDGPPREYLRENVESQHVDNHLDLRGSEGWELHTYTERQDGVLLVWGRAAK